MLSTKVDIWSFGCVLLALFTGHRPYDNIKHEAFYIKVEICDKGITPLDYMLDVYKKDFESINDHKEFVQLL